MATATLSLASILASTGWTGATTTNLNTSDNARATGGTVNESILADLVDVPADWQVVSGDVLLRAEALTSGNATRAKRLLLELLDSQNAVLGSGETGNLSTTEAVVTITLSGRSDTQAQANGWRIRATVLEGGGKGDNVSVSIDRLWVEATYDNSLPAITGSGSGTLTPAGAGRGWSEVEGSGVGVLALTGGGSGTVTAPLNPIAGSGSGALALVGAGRGWSEVWGGGRGALALAGVGTGIVERDEVEGEPVGEGETEDRPLHGKPVTVVRISVSRAGGHPVD